MAMSEMQKWRKQIEAGKRRAQKRKDVKDLRNAGIYSNGVNAYIDEDGHPLDGVVMPAWFKNISKAWESTRWLGQERRSKKHDETQSSMKDKWNEWCDEKVDFGCSDYRISKSKVGRPRLPDHLKKEPTKVKRSTLMKELLLANTITVDEDMTLRGENGLYIGWKFQINGRVRFEDEDPISVHQFLTLI